jgi:hypothetical protein
VTVRVLALSKDICIKTLTASQMRTEEKNEYNVEVDQSLDDIAR